MESYAAELGGLRARLQGQHGIAFHRGEKHMPEIKQGEFEGWAVLELMGHQREIGFVTTEAFGQAVLFRVDTPALEAREYVLTRPEYCRTDDGSADWMAEGTKVQRQGAPARTRLVAPGSLYAINPCTQEAAMEALESSTPRPIIALERPKRAALAAAAEPEEDCECDDECEEDCDCMCHDPHARHASSI
jgi:hypothetical protein